MDEETKLIEDLTSVKNELVNNNEQTSLMTVENIKNRIIKIKQLYKEVLILDQDYGRIPGTKRDTLLKPGSEKLNMMFQLINKVDKENITNLENNHREYIITIGLYHKNTGVLWGQGVGSCSTLESKYRYRYGEGEIIGPVTKEYWNHKNNETLQEYYNKYPNLKNAITKKTDVGWKFMKRGEKIDNPDIADVYNTVYKMAYKRALVSATIASTGVSDIFTQDAEDFQEKEPINNTSFNSVSSLNYIMSLISKCKNCLDKKQSDYYKAVYRAGSANYKESDFAMDKSFLEGLINNNASK